MSEMNDAGPGPLPSEDGAMAPGWQRWIVPGLALLACLAALAAFVAWRQLNPGTQPYTGQRIDLVPEDSSSPFLGFAIQPERPAPDFSLTDHHGQTWRLADQRGTPTALFFGYSHCPDVCPQTLQRLAEAMGQLGDAAGEVRVALITVDPERDTAERLATYVGNYHRDFLGLFGSPAAIQAVAKDYGVTYMKELPPAMATQAALIASHDAPVLVGHAVETGAGQGSDADHDAAVGGHGSGSDHGAGGHDTGAHEAPASVLQPGTDAYTMAHSGVVFLIDGAGRLRSSFLGPFTPEEVAHDLRLLLAER